MRLKVPKEPVARSMQNPCSLLELSVHLSEIDVVVAPVAVNPEGAAGPLAMRTIITAVVKVLPAVSVIRAARVWVPAVDVVVFQLTEYGVWGAAAPSTAPS